MHIQLGEKKMIEKQKSIKLNCEKISIDSDWIRLISEIDRTKPKYGNLVIELKFHNGYLAKVCITSKTDTLLFKKENDDEKS
jgi:hypothetical protein